MRTCMQAQDRLRAIALAVLLGSSFAAPAWAQTMTNVHVSSAGVQANNELNNDPPVMSDDGRYVAFSSIASNLVAGDSDDSDIFVHDNLTGATVLITTSVAEGRRPSITADGRFIAFQGPGANAAEIYRHDRDADADGIFDEPGATSTIVVSVSATGGTANGVSRCYSWAISHDGNVVAFESEATNLVTAPDTNGECDCFVRVISTGTTTRVSGNGNLGSYSPAMSGNGVCVVFASLASNLVPGGGDTNGGADIFWRNLVTGVLSRVSVSTGGGQASGQSWFPVVSDDGVVIAFWSEADDLVPGDTRPADDVFVHNILTGATTRVSVASDGTQADGPSSHVAISGDGSVVAFMSYATNFAGPPAFLYDVYAHDLVTGATVRASRAVDGTMGDAPSTEATVNGDGSMIGFRSYATNLLGPGGDTNGFGDAFVRGGPFLGPGGGGGGGGGGGPAGVDGNPVSFSVNGPVDPHSEGIRDARGAVPTPQVPLEPGNPIGFCIRTPVPQATGLPTPRPGDVFDYNLAPVPSEAEVFQSAPPPPPPGGPPDGTDNQIVATAATGLVAGLGVPPPLWVSLPPEAMPRDNMDAFSFGEDYFPPMIMTGLDPATPFLPDPPFGPGGEIAPAMTPWPARFSVYKEPVVLADEPGISFRFSVNPWGLGLPGTAVFAQSGGADLADVCGPAPSLSPGEAAGDVFGTPLLMRAGGVTLFGGTNLLVHDNPTLALAAPPAIPITMEDDLDAVECVGTNTVPWFGGAAMMPGNVHDRVMDAGGPDLPMPGESLHDVVNTAPLFFSVTRNSTGAPGSAVRSQFVLDGGAAADIFVTAKDLATPAGVGTNLLLIDEAELGLLAVDAPSPTGTSPLDMTDDLDALILWVSPDLRFAISMKIEELMMTAPWMTDPLTGANEGPGMTVSIVSLLDSLITPGSIRVGFSVTTDAVGLEYTGVDYEAGPVFPPGGVAAAAGDIYYAEPDGDPANTNYLWYQETDVGLEAGAWVNGAVVPPDLMALSDNLDALDSIDQPPDTTHTGPPTGTHEGEAPPMRLMLEPNYPNPFNPTTTIAYSLPQRGDVRVTIHDVRGRWVATLVDEVKDAGRHRVLWNGRDHTGAALGSGIYLVRIEAGGESGARKIVMVK